MLFRPARGALAARDSVTFDTFNDFNDVEQQAAGGGIGLDQLDPQPIAEAVSLAGTLADQQLAALVMAEELLA